VTFEAAGVVVLSFLPQIAVSDLNAEELPSHHRNIDMDAVTLAHTNDDLKGRRPGGFSFTPQGVLHGVHEAFRTEFQTRCTPGMRRTCIRIGVDSRRLLLGRERDIPEHSGACRSFRLAQPLLCNGVLFERDSVGWVNRALRRQDASGRATRNSLGAYELGDHGFVIARDGRLPSLPEHLAPPVAIERGSRVHLDHKYTEARVAQTAAQTPSDGSNSPAADPAVVCRRTASYVDQADEGNRGRLSGDTTEYRRVAADVRSMCSSRYPDANLGQ
jgi:hypothetical protein